MKIVVWETPQIEESGETKSMWMACLATHAISASGPTCANAVFQLVRWLRLSMDENDSSVPQVDLVIYDPPTFPEDHIKSLESEALLRKRRLTSEDQAKLFAEAELAFRVRGLPAPPLTSHPVYPPASEFVADRFEHGVPFSDANIVIPEGWDVRVWTE